MQIQKWSERLSELARASGLVLRAPKGPIENALRPEESQQALLKSHLDFFETAYGKGEKLMHNQGLSWLALVEHKLKAPEDWYESFSPYDSVEFFDANQNCIFRNLEFFRYTEHAFAELLLLPFRSLFQRDRSISEQFWSELLSKGFFAESDWRTFQFHLGIHRIVEKPTGRVLAIKPKSIAGLKDDSGLIRAVAVVTDTRLISK